MADENDDASVLSMCCQNGIDWAIRHSENDQVLHTTLRKEVGIIAREGYRQLVIEFAHEVEEFYRRSAPNLDFDDDFDRKEWRKLKREIGHGE